MVTPTSAQLMADNVTLTPGQVAQVLGLVHTRGAKAGQPNRHLVAELVATGRLTPVDVRQPLPRWSFATSAVRRYIDEADRLIDSPILKITEDSHPH